MEPEWNTDLLSYMTAIVGPSFRFRIIPYLHHYRMVINGLFPMILKIFLRLRWFFRKEAIFQLMIHTPEWFIYTRKLRAVIIVTQHDIDSNMKSTSKFNEVGRSWTRQIIYQGPFAAFSTHLTTLRCFLHSLSSHRLKIDKRFYISLQRLSVATNLIL